jgi:hypothetical protein
MTMTKHPEQLPRPAAELERLAEYYDTHDTSTEMDNGDWVEPQPMATTSLRLPADVIDQLKQQARTRHVRYTTYVRSILERAARSGSPPELAEITERLERIERALSGGPPHDDQKTALRTSVPAAASPPDMRQDEAEADCGGAPAASNHQATSTTVRSEERIFNFADGQPGEDWNTAELIGDRAGYLQNQDPGQGFPGRGTSVG